MSGHQHIRQLLREVGATKQVVWNVEDVRALLADLDKLREVAGNTVAAFENNFTYCDGNDGDDCSCHVCPAVRLQRMALEDIKR